MKLDTTQSQCNNNNRLLLQSRMTGGRHWLLAACVAIMTFLGSPTKIRNGAAVNPGFRHIIFYIDNTFIPVPPKGLGESFGSPTTTAGLVLRSQCHRTHPQPTTPDMGTTIDTPFASDSSVKEVLKLQRENSPNRCFHCRNEVVALELTTGTVL